MLLVEISNHIKRQTQVKYSTFYLLLLSQNYKHALGSWWVSE
jgi:hypothetical protein